MIPPCVLWLLSFADVFAGAVKVDQQMDRCQKNNYAY